MKRYICRQNPKYHRQAAIRIISEVLDHIPDKQKVMVLIEQDIKALTKSGPGVYYVVTELPKNANVIISDVGHYFYRFQVCNKKKRIQTFLIPRNPRVR